MTDFITNVNDCLVAIRPILNLIEPLKTISSATIIVAGFKWIIDNHTYKEVKLSCGTFKVRRKDFTWQKLTPLVSRLFFNGGNVENDIRKEILNVTGLPVKNVVYLQNNRTSTNKETDSEKRATDKEGPTKKNDAQQSKTKKEIKGEAFRRRKGKRIKNRA